VQGSCAASLAIELVVPFLILAPRRVRHLACALLVSLQLLIAATGNYGFFNLLTLVLCLTLLDDQALAALGAGLRRAVRRGEGARRSRSGSAPVAGGSVAEGASGAAACGLAALHGELPPWVPQRRAPRVQRVALALFSALVLAVGGLQVAELFVAGPRVSREQMQAGMLATLASDGPIAAAGVLERRAGPFLSINSYGLFRVMTKTRPEILISGSADGETWRDYAFRWKPGDLRRVPGWAQPHMPRLDWLLWFEALEWEVRADGSSRWPYEPNPWFGSLLHRLLEGEPAVLALLAENPFPDGPPRSVRASLSRYRFTTLTERADSGAWWIAEPLPGATLQLTRRE
jgi:lipase maturation factor 1